MLFTSILCFDMKSHYWETRESMTPGKALSFLHEGNDRFINNLRINRNLLQAVDDTAERQIPFATILSCSDSRVSPALIFDQGLGDHIRLAMKRETNTPPSERNSKKSSIRQPCRRTERAAQHGSLYRVELYHPGID